MSVIHLFQKAFRGLCFYICKYATLSACCLSTVPAFYTRNLAQPQKQCVITQCICIFMHVCSGKSFALNVSVLKHSSGQMRLFIALRLADHSEAATLLNNDNSTYFLTSIHYLAIRHAYTQFDHMSCTRPVLFSCV